MSVPDVDGSALECCRSMPDPLPQAYLLGGPVLAGRIKERPEDFLVDELPLYEPCGSGEHLYLGVQKTNMPHGELLQVLSRHYDVGLGDIGFAGMKDKVGVTRQAISLHLPGRADPQPPQHERLAVLWQARHTNKLRRGHLAGNRFSIRIRGVEPTAAPLVWRGLRRLAVTGVPDSFGPQRFGYRRNNHRMGWLLLKERWEDAIAELVGSKGSWHPPHQETQRRLADQGRWAESLPLWSRADGAERAALRALASGRDARRACMAIDPDNRQFWISALQSAIFNRVVDARLGNGTFATLGEGDVALQHHNGAVFQVGPEALADATPEKALAGRLERFEISPSGPLPGPGMVEPRGSVAALESEAAAAYHSDAALFASGLVAGARRPLRVRVSNPEIDAGFDEHGPFVRTAFDLPKGAYATVLLREIVGDASAAAADEGH
ncbi:MAG: tRNA pseudouridine(13) synthase TruD [Phycisphaerales bacterium]